jgi:hypothetical protein
MERDHSAGVKLNAIARVLASNWALRRLHVEITPTDRPGEEVIRTQPGGPAILKAAAANPNARFVDLCLRHLPLNSAADTLVQILGKVPAGQLERCDLAFGGLNGAGLSAVLNAIGQHARAIEVLDLSGNDLRLAEAEAANLFAHLEEAESLLLGSSHALTSLASIAAPALRLLDLSGNAWTPHMAAALQALMPQLTTLRLRGALMPDTVVGGLSLLMTGGGGGVGLKVEVDLAETPALASADAMSMLTQALAASTNPWALSLRACELADTGLSQLAHALNGNKSLTKIDLAANVASAALDMPLGHMQHWCARATSFEEAGDVYRQFVYSSNAHPLTFERLESASKLTGMLVHNTALTHLGLAGAPLEGRCFGPLLSMPLHLGLSVNGGLQKLDISGNLMMDSGAIHLGSALRRNRSLTWLRWDDNYVGLQGLKAFRGCLYGNKKLTDAPFCDRDMSKLLESFASMYKASLVQERQARNGIAGAYAGRRGMPHQGHLAQAMATLKEAKSSQAKARVAKDQARKLAAAIQAALIRNRQVSDIKSGAKNARTHAKLAVAGEKSGDKLDSKAQLVIKNAETKVWTVRHEAMLKWRSKVAKVAKRDKALDLGWWPIFNAQWGRNFLSLAAMRALWDKVPEAQRPLFQDTHAKSQSSLQAEVKVLEKVSEIQMDAAAEREEAAYHKAMEKYYSDLARSADPKKVMPPATSAGIVITPPPGVARKYHVSAVSVPSQYDTIGKTWATL